MLGIWVSTGRHAWKNDRFDKLVNDAAALVGDMAKRSAMFKEAEKIMVEDVAGVFLWHVTPGTMWKPYVKGSELTADKNGMVAWHWPGIEGIGQLHLTTYISRDVDRYRRK
jgi:peptide/nickel transport system substrate-binding protein/oligopeptide transport system substrate-binding protein